MLTALGESLLYACCALRDLLAHNNHATPLSKRALATFSARALA